MHTHRGFNSRFRAFTSYISGLRECSVAVHNRRKPSGEALMAIGLDPDALDKVNWR